MALSKSTIKEIRSLSTKKFRDREGKFLIEGFRLLDEAAGSDFNILETYFTRRVLEQPGGKGLLERLRRKTQRVEQISEKEIASIADTVTSQGLLAVVRRRTFSVDTVLQAGNGNAVLAAFDAVADPGNLGSMIRTCAWFGLQGILLGSNSVELCSPKALRATMGAVFHMPVAEDVDLLLAVSKAKAMRYTIYVTDQKGETHFDRVSYAGKSLIVFGNEAWGVSDQLKQLADVRVAIRRYGPVESLNVGVACGIVLSRIRKLADE